MATHSSQNGVLGTAVACGVFLLAVPAARGEGLVFQGDTLGINVNLSWIAAAAFIGLFLLALIAAIRAKTTFGRANATHAAQPLGRWALGLAAALAAVQVP